MVILKTENFFKCHKSQYPLGCSTRRVQELQLESNDFISPQYNLLVNYKEDLRNFQVSGERSSFR